VRRTKRNGKRKKRRRKKGRRKARKARRKRKRKRRRRRRTSQAVSRKATTRFDVVFGFCFNQKIQIKKTGRDSEAGFWGVGGKTSRETGFSPAVS